MAQLGSNAVAPRTTPGSMIYFTIVFIALELILKNQILVTHAVGILDMQFEGMLFSRPD